ncbi:hypothetical protein [Levilactobacillus cerevisiae]|uniref:hypothetical protein n=1 Tax=Levilactobacillus cerevisiae TaxID=1704076 RepID=UPI000F7A3FAA|nr:hypothetical protein [Levilactobacillus cerevisiae]
MKEIKWLLTTLLMLGVAVLLINTTPTTANADTTVNGMPKALRHVWIRGRYKTKITKYHIYWAPKGTHYTTHISFKKVLKSGQKYTVNRLDLFEQTPYWIKGHKMYHGMRGDANDPLTIWHR